MACEAQAAALEDATKRAESEARAMLAQIATDAEQRSSALASEFEHDQDLAAGVGAAAGTSIGGALGGPAGAAAGAVVGKTIGSLFVLEIRNEERRVVLDLPQVTMGRHTVKVDVPSVEMRDTDISFSIPTLVMKRVQGPPVPESVTRMRTRCVGAGPFRVCTDVPEVTVVWKPTWLDVPTYEMREQHIVIGMPTVRMRQEELSFGVPEVAVKRTEMVFQVPSITLRYVKDAGRRAAEAAAVIARDAQVASEKAKLELKERLKAGLLPPTNAVFACAQAELERAKAQVGLPFDPEIAKLSDALKALKVKGVPESDDDFVRLNDQLEDVVSRREKTVAQFDGALADLAAKHQAAIETLLRG